MEIVVVMKSSIICFAIFVTSNSKPRVYRIACVINYDDITSQPYSLLTSHHDIISQASRFNLIIHNGRPMYSIDPKFGQI